jgi:hypothetical protein
MHTDIYPIQFKYTFFQQTIINPIKCLGLQVKKKITIYVLGRGDFLHRVAITRNIMGFLGVKRYS